VRLWRVWLDAELAQQILADQVRHAAVGFADAKVDARLAEVHRLQLRVAVGEVHEADVAESGQLVQAVGGGRAGGQHVLAGQGHAAGAGNGQHLHEFSATNAHMGPCAAGVRVARPGAV
jgi:hypothetical protein